MKFLQDSGQLVSDFAERERQGEQVFTRLFYVFEKSFKFGSRF
jgi:hypothetical protein